jgi:TolB-like protein/DNA-binding CsgD family transcriptional regulator/Flp pilus assembly protein TadD
MDWGSRTVSKLDAGGPAITGLSHRESDVAIKFAAGMTYREIGDALFIAPATVRTHLSTIYEKLGVRNKVGLASLVAAGVAGSSANTTEPDGGGNQPTVVAVLPFVSFASGETLERLADGLANDLMMDLARYRQLAVISRQTMMSFKGRTDDACAIGRELNADYLVEGSVQSLKDRLRVRVQLVDARTGASVWTTRRDEDLEDHVVAQEAVLDHVVNVLASYDGTLANLRRTNARRKMPANLQAYDHYVLGVELKHRCTRETNVEAMEHFRKAVALDPSLARAWSAMGIAHATHACSGFAHDVPKEVAAWRMCLERALELDPDDSHARVCYGDLKALDGDMEAAKEAHDKALLSAPNDADTLSLLAGSRIFVTGSAQEGRDLARRALALNPLAPPWYYGMLARGSFVVGDHADAVKAFGRAPQKTPLNIALASMSYLALGETEKAQQLSSTLENEFADFTIEGFIMSYPVTNPEALVALRNGALAMLPQRLWRRSG